jgi:hypothetical protein
VEKRTERITEIAVVAGIIMLIGAVILIAFFTPIKTGLSLEDVWQAPSGLETKSEQTQGAVDLVLLNYSLPNQTAGQAEAVDVFEGIE